jgi:hypothetical protein
MGGYFLITLPLAVDMDGNRAKLLEANKERRKTVADYCDCLACATEEMVNELERGIPPKAALSAVLDSKQRLPTVFRGLVSDEVIHGLLSWLQTAYTADNLLEDYQSQTVRECYREEAQATISTLHSLAAALRNDEGAT